MLYAKYIFKQIILFSEKRIKMDKNKRSIFLIFLLVIPLIFVLPTIALELDSSEKNLDDYTIKVSVLPTNVVINEVLFDDSLYGDAGEFIELYNPTATAIDISLWNI